MATDAKTQAAQEVAKASPPPALPPSSAVLDQMSDQDLGMLDQVLAESVGFMDNPELHEKDAYSTLFGVKESYVSPSGTRLTKAAEIVDSKKMTSSRLPSLSAADERRIFMRLNYARMRIAEILGRFAGKPLDEEATKKLVAWGFRAQETRDLIVQLNVPLVLAMAKRTRLAGVDFNEMISEGNMALLRSVDKFDCGRGFKFSTYGCRAILKSFSRVAMRASRYRYTFPTEFDPAMEKSDYIEQKREVLKEDCVDELKSILSKNLAALTPVEKTVIEERFALDRTSPEAGVPKTLEQVGNIIGVTKERVRQIQNKALRKIRSALEDTYLAA